MVQKIQFSAAAKKIQIKSCVLQKDNAEVLCVGHLQEAQNQDYLVLPLSSSSCFPHHTLKTPQKTVVAIPVAFAWCDEDVGKIS